MISDYQYLCQVYEKHTGISPNIRPEAEKQFRVASSSIRARVGGTTEDFREFIDWCFETNPLQTHAAAYGSLSKLASASYRYKKPERRAPAPRIGEEFSE